MFPVFLISQTVKGKVFPTVEAIRETLSTYEAKYLN